MDAVSITAIVTDEQGRFVSGLGRDDFTIFEDGQSRDALFFVEESVPVSLGIILNASGSMNRSKLQIARESIRQLVFDHLDQRDQWFFARFGYSLFVTQEWTADRGRIIEALRGVRATGDTALYQAIALAIPMAGTGRFHKKALLLVSDGGETRSLLSLADVQHAIGVTDVRVYGLGIQATHVDTLRRVTAETGGRTEIVASQREIPAAIARIADDLHHQYWLSYSTDAQKDGRWHALQVEVRGRGMKVRSRRGFVAN